MIQDAWRRFRPQRLELTTSLWFLPALITLGLALLGVVLVAVDTWLWDHDSVSTSVFRGGVDGSRGVLTAIAGSLISAAAVVFSITVVTLQLASSQFTPRVLRSFTGDRQFQGTLGLMLGTFTYCLVVLWSVGREEPGREPFVPTISTAGSIVLALVSVAVLIAFIHRVASLIQVSILVDEVVDETLSLVKRTYDDPEETESEFATAPEFSTEPGAPVPSTKAGYVRGIDTAVLLRIAEQATATIRVTHDIGDFILTGADIAWVHPASMVSEELESQVRSAFSVGPERISIDDVDLGVRQVADIALKALSPGINDPTTAISCIDSLTEILAEVSRRVPKPVVHQAETGGMVVVEVAPEFSDLVDEAFTQIRIYGASDVMVSEHLARRLGDLTTVAREEHWSTLAEHGRLVPLSSCAVVHTDADCGRVRDAAAWAVEEDEAADVGA